MLDEPAKQGPAGQEDILLSEPLRRYPDFQLFNVPAELAMLFPVERQVGVAVLLHGFFFIVKVGNRVVVQKIEHFKNLHRALALIDCVHENAEAPE
jgi:hypothetical protein